MCKGYKLHEGATGVQTQNKLHELKIYSKSIMSKIVGKIGFEFGELMLADSLESQLTS